MVYRSYPQPHEATTMAKIIRCSDVGFDCDGVIRAETEDEALQQAAQHAQAVHGVDAITDDVIAKVKAAMRDA
jgi:predicted small metal-binding protein